MAGGRGAACPQVAARVVDACIQSRGDSVQHAQNVSRNTQRLTSACSLSVCHVLRLSAQPTVSA